MSLNTKPMDLVRKPEVSHNQHRMSQSQGEFATSTELDPARSSSIQSNFSSLSMTERQKRDSFFLSGSVYLITSDGKTVSLPVPSSNPYDPLNWSYWKRALNLLPLLFLLMVCSLMTQGVGVVVGGLAKDFPEENRVLTMEDMLTIPTLGMGLGIFLWVPLTSALGRRPPLIFSTLLAFLASVGSGLCTSFSLLVLCIFLIGFAQGVTLSVAFLIIIDMTFIHERPAAIAVVWSLGGFFVGAGIVAIPSATDNGNHWRGFYYFHSAAAGLTFLLAFFCFTETYFKRPTVAYDGLTIIQTASEKLTIYEDNSDPRWSLFNKDLPSTPSRNYFQSVIDQCCLRVSRASWKKFLHCYPQILFCMLNPLIFWVVIVTAINFAGMMYIGATYGEVLSAEPYNLTPQYLSFVNGSAGIGSLFALPFSGFLVCFALKKLARRNKGVREAEHYLIAYILPVLTGALSTILYGLTIHYNWHFGFVYLAYGFNSYSFVGLGVTNTLWVTEAFPRWAAPALVVVSGGSYVVSYAMSFALPIWIARHGYFWVGIEITIMQVVSGLVICPIVFWGKGLRQKINGRWGKWAEGRDGALRPM